MEKHTGNADPQALVRWAILHMGCPINDVLTNVSTACGNVEVLKWLNRPMNTELWFVAAYNRQIQVMNYLKAIKCPWNDQTAYAAASGGSIRALKWLKVNAYGWVCDQDSDIWQCRDLRALWRHTVCNAAASGGQLRTLAWLIEYNYEQCDNDIYVAAAFGGSFHVLRYLRIKEPCVDWPTKTYEGAIASNNALDVLTWLLSNNVPLPEYVPTVAARLDKREVINWLIFNGCQLMPDLVSTCVSTNNNDLLKFLLDRDCAVNTFNIMKAIDNGNLHMIEPIYKRLSTQPTLLHNLDDCCTHAARKGNIQALKILRAQIPQCPWTSQVIETALSNHHSEIYEWAIENGCPRPTPFTEECGRLLFSMLNSEAAHIIFQSVIASPITSWD
jgi:hypothetical protein